MLYTICLRHYLVSQTEVALNTEESEAVSCYAAYFLKQMRGGSTLTKPEHNSTIPRKKDTHSEAPTLKLLIELAFLFSLAVLPFIYTAASSPPPFVSVIYPFSMAHCLPVCATPWPNAWGFQYAC